MNRALLLSSILVGSLALGACSGSTAAQGDGTSQTAAAATKGPVAPQVKGHLRLLADALADVPLRPDQRTEIEQLAKDAQARHDASRQAHADVMNALAAQIEAGAIDRAALQPKIDAAAQAWDQSRPADRAAIERLHAILTPEQRAQLTAAIKSHMHAKVEGHAFRGHMQEWASDLKLTDAQRDQIRDVLKGEFHAHRGDFRDARAKGKAVLDAFEQDRFVMDEVAPKVDARARVNEMSGRVLSVVEKVLPILTPEQRQLAAAKLRARAASGDDAPFGH